MADWDINRITAATDELLRTTENPRHRAILTNYRRHALLEVSGRYEEILVPEMTIEHPVYRLTEGPATLVLDAHQQVHDFYAMLSAAGAIVMGPAEEELVVADWGFASECMFHHLMPAGCSCRARTSVLAPPAAHVLLEHQPGAAQHRRPRVRECLLDGRPDEERQVPVAHLGGQRVERREPEALQRVGARHRLDDPQDRPVVTRLRLQHRAVHHRSSARHYLPP
jgi:hypothetical protein